MMEEKDWYKSKKFWTIIFTMLIGAGNEAFEWGISTDQGLGMMIMALAYVLIQAGLDWYMAKRKLKRAVPMELPMVREGIESLVNSFYDFNKANQEGISAHAKEVKALVIDGLDELVTAELYAKLKDDAQVVDEILRLVFKYYNQDSKMKEGADLMMASMKNKAAAE